MGMCGDSKNKVIADNYLKWFSLNYTPLKNKYRKYCIENHYEWDEDIFSDTYLRIYEKILRNGLKDNSETGFNNYTFKSFKQNLQREKQYCRNSKRDANIDSESLHSLYEEYYNSHNNSSQQKLKNDLYIDFATLYIMHKVDENFDYEHSYLFRTKHLCNLTYKELAQMSNIKGVRQKVLTVKNWVKDNVTKDELQEAFQRIYGDLL